MPAHNNRWEKKKWNNRLAHHVCLNISSLLALLGWQISLLDKPDKEATAKKFPKRKSTAKVNVLSRGNETEWKKSKIKIKQRREKNTLKTSCTTFAQNNIKMRQRQQRQQHQQLWWRRRRIIAIISKRSCIVQDWNNKEKRTKQKTKKKCPKRRERDKRAAHVIPSWFIFCRIT